MWKSVEPEHAQEHHFDNKAGWVALEGSCVVGAAGALLYCADATFDFGNVLVFAGSVEGSAEVSSGMSAAASNFHGCMDRGDFETTLTVCFVDIVYAFGECAGFTVGESFGGHKMDIP